MNVPLPWSKYYGYNTIFALPLPLHVKLPSLLARALPPIAMAYFPFALFIVPIATAFTPEIVLVSPIQTPLVQLTLLLFPIATAGFPATVLFYPIAMEFCTCALLA